MKTMPDPRSQRGNILFLILLAVVLFAALSYAVTQSMRGGGNNANKESASANVSEIVQYLTGVRASIQRMRLVNNCSDTQISFDYNNGASSCLTTETPATGYENANSPTDCRCHVFHPLGGGVPWRDGDNLKLPGVAAGNTTFNYVGKTSLNGIGTNAADLYAAIFVNTVSDYTDAMDQWCLAFNKQVGSGSLDALATGLYSVWESPKFTGTYDSGVFIGAAYNGLPAACHRYGGGAYYMSYFALLER